VLPPTCQLGQLFFNAAAAAGSNLYACTSTNTWTAEGGGGASGNQPQATFSSSNVTFGSQNIGTTSGLQSITLENLGTALLTINSVQITGTNAADFASSNTCGTILASGANCTISLTFTPSIAGTETATLTINDSQLGSPQTITIQGTGAAPINSGGLVITPSAQNAQAGSTVTFTSNRAVNWALATGSSGTLTANSPTAATYTAPASIPTQNALAGCPVLPNDSVFNVRIDSLLVNTNSTTWSANMGTNGIGFDTSWGTSIGDNTVPLTSESFNYTPTYNGPWFLPGVPSLKRENGDYIGNANSEDHHVLAVNRSTCQFYEMYNNYLTPLKCSNTTGTCTAQSGWKYNSSSYALPVNGATDAAGLPIGPLTLHLDEIKSGVIKHALRFTVARGFIQGGTSLWPAIGTNGWGGNNTPPYGTRFRLQAGYNISGFNATAQVILTALKQYGMFVADIGPGPTITASTDLTEDASVMAAIGQIQGAHITMNNFEAVDESGFMVSASSSQVNPANGHVTPASFAVLTATDQNNSNFQAVVPIPLQGVTIGLPSPTMWIMAGMSGYQLSWWVNGTSNQNVTWSLVSGTGSVTTGGVYTPPASVTGPTGAVLLATSAADPNSQGRLYVTVIPVGSNPTGSIRIDTGNGSGTTDKNGNVWLGDQAIESGDYVQLSGDYPGWSATSNPELAIYQSSGHTYGTDMVYNFVVPNGNYKIRLMFGQPYNGSSPSTCSPFPPSWHAPLDLETQGQTQIHNYDFGLPISYACATPVDQFIPAQVTNNTLEIALRAVVPEGSTATPSPALNGLEIIPDTTAPSLAIDTQQVTTVNAGSTLQLYAVGWYMSNAVTWTMSGPGSISSTGLYTAPTAAPASPQTVTVVATSTVNPSISASATLTVPIGSSLKKRR